MGVLAACKNDIAQVGTRTTLLGEEDVLRVVLRLFERGRVVDGVSVDTKPLAHLQDAVVAGTKKEEKRT